jgi:iron complex outermembrane receptor protein
MHNLRNTSLALALAGMLPHAWADHTPPKKLESVTISGGRPSSLPTQIPTTMEGISGEQVEQAINAFDSEDALKYLPSLNVRKRYPGDYDHAVLASRASGTGNSARSLVYADGILLSNLLGNGATFTPRWGMVSPEEIERVDVLYGPFSAAYPGNSAGAVVEYQTRMPSQLEAHAKLSAFGQRFKLYDTDARFKGAQGSASVGKRQGAWSWWVDVSRLDTNSQPIGFATKLVSTGVVSTKGLPVTGAIAGQNPANKDWLIIGATSQAHTVQDHAKAKLAFDIEPTLRASYTLGWWQNEAVRSAQSYLRDAAGAPVYRGDADNAINIAGKRFDLKAADLAPSAGSLEHVMQGFSLKRHAHGEWDWDVAVSRYDYTRDKVRTPTVPVPDAVTNGQGNVTDMGGSGWDTLAAKGVWRPNPQHIVDLGAQRDSAHLRTLVYKTPDWIHGGSGDLVSTFDGDTRLQSLFAQDSWRFIPAWKATLGVRFEHWQAFGGSISNATSNGPRYFGKRSENSWSPKAAMAWQASPQWAIKGSLGRAVRNPTASELFQGSVEGSEIRNSNPNLQAEKSWTGELTAERALDNGVWRATLFHELTRDALYSQPLTPNVNTVQNVDKIRTTGLELAYQAEDVLVHGLSLSGSTTLAHSRIVENHGMPASIGKWQPRVPDVRATLLATYQWGEWSASTGWRYSGRQYGSLDNSDPHGDSYTGVSNFSVLDLRLRYRFNKQWSGALGVDNAGDKTYWAFHPYNQRTMTAEVRFDL